MGVQRIKRQDMLKLVVNFERRADGGLRAWSDDLPGFVLSHSNPEAVIADVPPALEAILSAKYECRVEVFALTPAERFELTPELPMPAFMIPQREYASKVC